MFQHCNDIARVANKVTWVRNIMYPIFVKIFMCIRKNSICWKKYVHFLHLLEVLDFIRKCGHRWNCCCDPYNPLEQFAVTILVKNLSIFFQLPRLISRATEFLLKMVCWGGREVQAQVVSVYHRRPPLSKAGLEIEQAFFLPWQKIACCLIIIKI